MSSELLESNEGLTRAKVLKRAGIVAAAAWSVPFFSSTADAAVTPSKGNVAACAGSDPNTGLLSPICEFQVCGSGKNGTTCYCYPGAKGTNKSSGCCVCGGNEFCTQSPPCATNGDCPRGWKCTFNGCGQTCVPPCGAGIAQPKGSGSTTAG
jgi:hypothetical protein